MSEVWLPPCGCERLVMPQRIEIVRVGVKVLCELLGVYELLGEGGGGR